MSMHCFTHHISHPFSFKKCSLFLLTPIVLLLSIILVLAFIVTFILKPHNPVFSVQDMRIDSYNLTSHSNSNSTLYVSANATLILKAQNPNNFGIKCDPSNFKIMYKGLSIGDIQVNGFYQEAHSNNLSVTSKVFIPLINVAQIIPADNNSNSTIQFKVLGDIKVHLHIPHIPLPKIKVFLECDMNFDPKNLILKLEDYTSKRFKHTHNRKVIDRETQLSNYRKVERSLGNDHQGKKKKKCLSKAVYLFSIGTNDYMSLYVTNSTMLNSFSHSQYVGMVIRNLTAVIKEINKTGARKFVFINLPNLGCLPGMRIIRPDTRGNCLTEASSLAKLHNKELTKMLIKLEKQFKNLIIDLNSHLKQRMNHPMKYGLKEGKAACCRTGMYRGVFSCGEKRIVKEFQLCENPNHYAFWDSYHFTEMFYKQLADQIWSQPTQTNLIGPYNLSQLFS